MRAFKSLRVEEWKWVACWLLLLSAIFYPLSSSRAANVSFTFTNSVEQPDTNWFLAIPVSGPVANADGSFTTIGVPIRIQPNTNGYAQTNLAQNNYQITNRFLGQGYYIRVPLDNGGTVYPSGQLLISGGNTFVTVQTSFGGTNVPTFNQLTNVLNGTPLVGSNLPALTNGYVTLTDLTNATWRTNGLLGANGTNGFAGTNVTITQSNYFQTIIGSGIGISASTATNIANGQGTNIILAGTNAMGVGSGASAFVSTNRFDTNGAAAFWANLATNGFPWGALYDLAGAALGATNGMGPASGLAAFVNTNRFDTNGAAIAVGANGTNNATVVSNGVMAAEVAGTNNVGIGSGLSAFVSTNRFDVSGAGIAAANLVGANGTNNATVVSNGVLAALVASTNNLGPASGLAAFVSTNTFDTNGEGAAYAGLGSNSLRTAIVSATNLQAAFNTNTYALSNRPTVNALTNYGTLTLPAGNLQFGVNGGSMSFFPTFGINGSLTLQGNGVIANSGAPQFDTNSIIVGFLSGDGGGTGPNGGAVSNAWTSNIQVGNASTQVTNWAQNVFFALSNAAYAASTNAAQINALLSILSASNSIYGNATNSAQLNTLTSILSASNATYLNGLAVITAGTNAVNIGQSNNTAGVSNLLGSAKVNIFSGIASNLNLAAPMQNALNLSNASGVLSLTNSGGSILALAPFSTSISSNGYSQKQTNIIGSQTNWWTDTNVLHCYSGWAFFMTNGDFLWTGTNYYNSQSGAVVTNTLTSFNLQTNGFTVNSINGSSPIGTYGIIGGAPAAVKFQYGTMLDFSGVHARNLPASELTGTAPVNTSGSANAATNLYPGATLSNNIIESATNWLPPWYSYFFLDSSTNLNFNLKPTNNAALAGGLIYELLDSVGNNILTLFWNPLHNAGPSPTVGNGEVQVTSSGQMMMGVGYQAGAIKHLQIGAPGQTEANPADLTTNEWSYFTGGSPYAGYPGYTWAETFQISLTPSLGFFPGFIGQCFSNDMHYELDELQDLNVSQIGSATSGDQWSILKIVPGNSMYIFTNGQYRGNFEMGAMVKEKRNGSTSGTNCALDFGTSALMDIADGSTAVTFYTTNCYQATNTTRWNDSWFVVRAAGNTVSLTYPSQWNTNQAGPLPPIMSGQQELILHLLSTGTGESNVIVASATTNYNASFVPDPLFYPYSAAAKYTNWTVNTLLVNLRADVALEGQTLNTNGLLYPSDAAGGSNAIIVNALLPTGPFNLTPHGTNFYTNGFGSDGVSGYADTGFNPSAQGYNASNITVIGFWNTNYAPANNTYTVGATGGSAWLGIHAQIFGGNFYWADGGVCDGQPGNLFLQVAGQSGIVMIGRTNSISQSVAGVDEGYLVGNVTAGSPPNQNLYVNARNNGGAANFYAGDTKFLLVQPYGLTPAVFFSMSNHIYQFLSANGRAGVNN